MANQLLPSILLVKWLKKNIWPNAKYVFGGAICSLMTKERLNDVIKKAGVDGVIVGEGEEAIVELAHYYSQKKKAFDNIPNLVYPKKKENVYTSEPLKQDINTYPPPLYDKNILKKWFRPGYSLMHVLIGRKCYWGKCAYCDFQRLYKMADKRDPKIVVNDIKHIIDIYNYSRFDLICDSVEPDYLRLFCREIIKQKINISYTAYIRVDPRYDDSLFSLMKKSGCEEFVLGLESLDDKVLKRIKKGYSKKIALEFIERALVNGLRFGINIITDLPGTTYSSAKRQYRQLKNILTNIINEGNASENYSLIRASNLDVTMQSSLANNPELYGIKVKRNTCRDTQLRANVVDWFDPSGMSNHEKNEINKLYGEFENQVAWMQFNNDLKECKNGISISIFKKGKLDNDVVSLNRRVSIGRNCFIDNTKTKYCKKLSKPYLAIYNSEYGLYYTLDVNYPEQAYKLIKLLPMKMDKLKKIFLKNNGNCFDEEDFYSFLKGLYEQNIVVFKER